MKIPKSLKIGGHKYEIEYPYLFKERTDIFGRADPAHNTIYITEIDSNGIKCSPSHTEGIFWHEVFHAIDKIYCCDGIGKANSKEEMIEGLAQGLFQVLKDNFKDLESK